MDMGERIAQGGQAMWRHRDGARGQGHMVVGT